MEAIRTSFGIILIFCLITVGFGATNPNDLKVLNDFRKGLQNPELLKWPNRGNDPCGPPTWPYVFCSGNRVTQIQAKSLGLKGSLPSSFNQLSELYNLGLQHNNLTGMLPTFSGLSKLEFAFLTDNQFDGIPSDFFAGLTSLQVLSLDRNSLNATTGWSLPVDLEESVQLTNLSLQSCNLVGSVPDFLGRLPSLTNLRLSYNRLSGTIPASFGQSSIQALWLNNQVGGGMTGPIDVIASMTSLTQLWLHGNQFTGTIPQNIGDLTSLVDLNLNGNELVGFIPESLANMELKKLDLNNNQLMGPIPLFKIVNVSYASNSFCQTKPGLECAPDVTALLYFLSNLSYPSVLTSKWIGNAPCSGPWLGLSCNPKSQVSIINFPRHQLNGTLSPSLSKLDSLLEIRLAENSLTGEIPTSFTELKSLRLLDLSYNNLAPPLPNFRSGVKIMIDGNPFFSTNQTGKSPAAPTSTSLPPSSSQSLPHNPSPPSSSHSPSSNSSGSVQGQSQHNESKMYITIAAVAGAGVFVFAAILAVFLFIYCSKKKKALLEEPNAIVVHPRDPSDPKDMVKISVSNKTTESLSAKTGTSASNNIIGESENPHVIDAGNLVISVQVLCKVTKNFSPENELGHGGFGTVYKGELEDGTKIAVKRMETGTMSSQGLHEFQAEIAVLSKVRHRHLVSLLGYSVEGNERLLVYEYMPLGALSKHLFHWKSLKLEPLSWSQRLVIALDVARGMEYLHGLARQIFIHRDLKPSNILLSDDLRAKVSDFGLVKLAPDGKKSIATKLAGTFGYLAPEYAVMGKITTKVDVFSYGVVLMELVTGRMALDESRPEESRYLVEWFWKIKSSKQQLMAAIDPALEATEETFESISIIAELAGHCTSREPNHRPNMCHVVSVLSPLVEKWIPIDENVDSFTGIDLNQPLPHMLKDWKDAEGRDVSHTSLEDSNSSIPVRPVGFADSFSSADAR